VNKAASRRHTIHLGNVELAMKKKLCFVALLCLFIHLLCSLKRVYNGLDNHLSSLYRLSHARTLSISPENPTGEKAKAVPNGRNRGESSPRSGQRLEDQPIGRYRGGNYVHGRRDHGARSDPAHLDDAHRHLAVLHFADVLGR
jgi:hypothetical protein